MSIKPAADLLVLNAPDGYIQKTDRLLPKGARRTDSPRDEHASVQLLARDSAELEAKLADALHSLSGSGHLCICYPKKSSRIQTDLSPRIRAGRVRTPWVCAASH